MGLRSLYLDANVLIEAVEGLDEQRRFLLPALHQSGQRLVTSELTLAEVLVKPIQAGQEEIVQVYETILLSGNFVDCMPVNLPILRKSAELRAEFGGKLPDTIHVATAVLAHCDLIVSSDVRLRMPLGMKRVSFADLLEGGSWP